MRVSVVIPLYNKKDTVLRAINSILNQTFLPYEIIVVNDGSTDGSEKIVEEFKHPLVHLIHQENSGVSVARNKGIEQAKEDWIAFLDADDVWRKLYLEKIYELNQLLPKAEIFATNYDYQDFEGKIYPTAINKIKFKGRFGKLENYFEVAANSSPPICSSAVVIKRDALLSIGLFPTGIKSGEDLITWAKLAVTFRIVYHRDPLSIFIHDDVQIHKKCQHRVPDFPDFVGSELSKLWFHHPDINGLRDYLAHWHKMRASIFLSLGMKSYCFKEIFQSLSYKSSNYRVWAYLIINIFPRKIVNQIFQKLKDY